MNSAARLSVAAVATAAVITGFTGCGDDAASESPRAGNSISPSELLGNVESGGFPPVASPWHFRFPADHGPHDQYRTEWWHLTGVLTDESGSRLGVQLSVARVGLKPEPLDRTSRWAATGIYAGQITLSGAGVDGLRTHQRVSRGALGLAGARARPLRIWVENWRLEQIDDAGPALALKIQVAAENLDVDLELHSTKPLVDANELAGQQAGQPAPFVFYIQPRLSAKGTLSIAGRPTRVGGAVSMEHAWGELPLPGGPVARDRFTLYLDDARELFCIRTHRVDGSGTPAANCVLVGREGSPLSLSSDEIEMEPLDHWENERTGTVYPVRWALRIPERGLELEIIPQSADQAGTGWMPSWAGPVRLELASGEPAGYGFVQLNGYDGS